MASSSNEDRKKATNRYEELLDIPTVTLAEAQQHIEMHIKHKVRRGAIILIGESGLGKTQIYHQIARKHGYDVRPIHTAQFGLMGAGIPRRADGQHFGIAVPDSFPKPGDKSLVLFDELNRGLQHAINMFFTLMEDGRMFDYMLPDDCLVVGAMNPADASYAVTRLENDPAVRRRLSMFWVVNSPSDWMSYAATPEFHYSDHAVDAAKGKPCHPDILAFFRAFPKLIYDEAARNAGRQFCCPASIQTISLGAWCMEADKVPLTGEFARAYFSSKIGITVTEQLIPYIADNAIALNADDVLYAPEKVAPAIEKLILTAQHEKLLDLGQNVMTLMFSDLDSKADIDTVAKNYLNFLCTLPLEQASSIATQAREHAGNADNKVSFLKRLNGALQHHKQWVDFHRKMDQTHTAVHREIQG